MRIEPSPTRWRIDEPSPSSIRANDYDRSERNEANVKEQSVDGLEELIAAHTYRVRLKETLASTSIRTMKISRNAMSPLTALKSAPLNRICLMALTE